MAACYPFMKRHTHLPQIVLGAAFSWSIPMAFAAQSEQLPPALWLLYIGNLLWTVAYDTQYAMVDRVDDLKAGIKSSAILFADADKLAIALLQLFSLLAFALAGQRFELGGYYFASLVLVAALFSYHQYLIRERRQEQCFKAFLNNNYVGLVLFLGLLAEYSLG